MQHELSPFRSVSHISRYLFSLRFPHQFNVSSGCFSSDSHQPLEPHTMAVRDDFFLSPSIRHSDFYLFAVRFSVRVAVFFRCFFFRRNVAIKAKPNLLCLINHLHFVLCVRHIWKCLKHFHASHVLRTSVNFRCRQALAAVSRSVNCCIRLIVFLK